MASMQGSTDADNGGRGGARGGLTWLAGYTLEKVLSLVEVGRLVIELPSGAKVEGVGARPGPEATVKVNNWRAVRRLLLKGDVGVASGYVDNDWSCSDLTALIELAALNGSRFMDAIEGSAPFRIFNWLAHRFKTNTRRGSRRNIEAHYDLGNDFYRQWLDAKMVYSSALYESASLSLEEAQAAKLKRIGEKLELDANCSVLEIGCGWGALATSLVRHSGAQVTGVTISPSQLEWAAKNNHEQGLDQRIDLRLQDYRDIEGRFDRIVSIEMIEAVGRE